VFLFFFFLTERFFGFPHLVLLIGLLTPQIYEIFALYQ